MAYIRKRTQSQGGGGYNNNNNGGQRRDGRQRFNNGGGHGNNRPRKNYSAMREKYLVQARDALASGDRVLAENYFQHADHCFRMMAEETASRPQRFYQSRNSYGNQAEDNVSEVAAEGDDTISMNVTSLPAFLTTSYEQPKREDDRTRNAPDWDEE